ncbi:MAG: hypothetical protein ABIO86_19240 [Sphingomonas sp.]
MESDERACPRCAETIKQAAVACRFCGIELTPPARQSYLMEKVSDGWLLRGMPRWGVLALAAFIFVVWASSNTSFQTQAAPTRVELSGNEVDAAVASADAASVPVASEEAVTEPASGERCLSAWDGANASLVKVVKGELNDPDSFAHDRTFISPIGKDGLYPIKMLFRSRNGFGGVVRGAAEGAVNPATCEATLKLIY